MKRSLPGLLGLFAVVVVIALLVGGGFLSLPIGDGDDSLADASEHHDPAPRDQAEPIEVDLEDDDSSDRKDKKGRQGADDMKGRKDRESREKRSVGDRPGDKAAETRHAPSVGKRKDGEPKPGATPPPRKDGSPPEKDPEPKDPAPVTVSDLTGDAQGEGQAPGYMDYEAVHVRAEGNFFFVDLAFAGNIPSKLSSGTAMVASFEVNRGDRKVSVYAEGSEDGWQAYTNRSAEAPAAMQLDGSTMRFTVPRSFFGERFEFYADTSWTKSTLTDTEYFFDFAPDDQNGQFPSGGTT